MDFTLPALRKEEVISLQLRRLYEDKSYRLYRVGSFEEYDLYMQNRPFLTVEDIITFTAADGRLMALKPDVTLSIVKNTAGGDVRRLYYTENIFRRSRQSGEYREKKQMGLEFIGGEGLPAEVEILGLALDSLAVIGRSALDLSHMEFIEAMLAGFEDPAAKQAAVEALRDKSPHGMRQAAVGAGLGDAAAENLAALAALAGEFDEALPWAAKIARGNAKAEAALAHLQQLYAALHARRPTVRIRLDFSIVNDADYYNGLIFQGYVDGVPGTVMVGGRYDLLLRRFQKPQGAIGFAVYLDALGAVEDEAAPDNAPPDDIPWLNVALPKGRLGDKVYTLFEEAGLARADVLGKTRKLVFEDAASRTRFFLVKPSDVDSYVEHGAADVGVVGKDVLLESAADVLELLDLDMGKCRLAVAGRADFAEDPARPLRVATKYPRVARGYYAAQSRAVEIIKLQGSIELAPLLGLSDVIVDIVETGSTLRENNLEVLAEIASSSARLIANRAAWRFKQGRMTTLVERLGERL
uniref:ATP phosphoribosyltransferase n=1 Tax=termite gut metagenome TaxID=433724 RepID=S0DDE9_9ZZZZ